MEQLGPRVRARAVELVEGFRVRVTFENDVLREIDLGPYLHGPVFEAVRADPAVFASLRVDAGAIVWDNGADIDPDVLYYGLKPAWVEATEADGALTSTRRQG